MSTYYGYHCEDCRKRSRMWLNHGDDYLRQLFTLRKQYYDILRVIENNNGDTWSAEEAIYAEMAPYVNDGTRPLRWLRKHEGHAIYLTNEYFGVFEPLSEGAPPLDIEAMRTRREEGFW